MRPAPFTSLTAAALPLMRDNVDTDAIIPSREMKLVAKDGLADGLFAGWRYTEVGGRTPDPDFVLNRPAYAGACILLAGSNFGCGSSREHAAWALAEYGFRAIVASSYNSIFRSNCVRNGIVPVEVAEVAVAEMARVVEASQGEVPVTVDLEGSIVLCAGRSWPFVLEHEARELLLFGLDAIDLTMRRSTTIARFQERDRVQRDWAYLERDGHRRHE